MLKKLLFCIISLLLLVSCASYNEDQIINELNNYFSKAKVVLDVKTNNSLPYYSFYLPSDMAYEDCVDENVVLKYNNSKMVMNLNISKIIDNSIDNDILYDEGYFIDDRLFYVSQGEYVNVDGTLKNYFVKVYKGDPYYIVHLMSDDVNTFAYCLKEETIETVKHVMLVARSTSVDYELVKSEYSNDNVVLVEKMPVDLFQSIMPEKGRVDELLTE